MAGASEHDPEIPERMSRQAIEKLQCACGALILPCSLTGHLKTIRHQRCSRGVRVKITSEARVPKGKEECSVCHAVIVSSNFSRKQHSRSEKHKKLLPPAEEEASAVASSQDEDPPISPSTTWGDVLAEILAAYPPIREKSQEGLAKPSA